MFNEILKEVENILRFASYQRNEEISDPFYYTKRKHEKRDKTLRKYFSNIYEKLKDVDFQEKLILDIDDVEDGIFLEVKKNNQRHYVINGKCPLKGVHIDYDEKYVLEDVTYFGARFLEAQT